MSLVHYEPDIAVVPCLGCNELVDADDLVRSDRVWTSSPASAAADLANEQQIAGWFELAHDDCPDADGWWARVRDAPADDELRLVYADWLEQGGDLARAAVVRLAVERRRSPAAARGPLNARLRAARRSVRGSWLRDVCAAR